MLKLTENPPLLYPEQVEIAQIDGPWRVAHTKARCEKAFAWDLLEREVPFFLPMMMRITISGGRKRRVMMPLFTSYVFFAGDQQIRYQALLTDRLAGVIEVTDQRRLIEELSAVKLAIDGQVPLDPYPFAAVGRRVRVSCGPFEGIEGTVIQREDGTTRLVLQVSMLGQGASMEIDTDLLEAID